jgi:hypothetical protein
VPQSNFRQRSSTGVRGEVSPIGLLRVSDIRGVGHQLPMAHVNSAICKIVGEFVVLSRKILKAFSYIRLKHQLRNVSRLVRSAAKVGRVLWVL